MFIAVKSWDAFTLEKKFTPPDDSISPLAKRTTRAQLKKGRLGGNFCSNWPQRGATSNAHREEMEETRWGRLQPSQLFTALDPTWESGRERSARRGLRDGNFSFHWRQSGGHAEVSAMTAKEEKRHSSQHRIHIWMISLLIAAGKLLWWRIVNGDHSSLNSLLGIFVCLSQWKAAVTRNPVQGGWGGWNGASVCRGQWIMVPYDRHPTPRWIRLLFILGTAVPLAESNHTKVSSEGSWQDSWICFSIQLSNREQFISSQVFKSTIHQDLIKFHGAVSQKAEMIKKK